MKNTLWAVIALLLWAGPASSAPESVAADPASNPIPLTTQAWNAFQSTGSAGLKQDIAALNDRQMMQLADEIALLEQVTRQQYRDQPNPFASFMLLTRQCLAARAVPSDHSVIPANDVVNSSSDLPADTATTPTRSGPQLSTTQSATGGSSGGGNGGMTFPSSSGGGGGGGGAITPSGKASRGRSSSTSPTDSIAIPYVPTDNSASQTNTPAAPVITNNTPMGPGFNVFNALAYGKMPDLTQFGVKNIRVIYGEMWPRGTSEDEPDEQTIRALARKLPTDRPVVFDIENWPTSLSQIDNTIDKLLRVIRWVKEENPQVKLGFFSLLPVLNYWDPVLHRTPSAQYLERNRKLAQVADAVDYIFVSLYTHHNKPDDWTNYAKFMIAQARLYGKPVYCFLWPEYAVDAEEPKFSPIPADVFANEVLTAGRLSDGVVLWGGFWRYQNQGPWLQRTWQNDMPWWVQVKNILTSPPGAFLSD